MSTPTIILREALQHALDELHRVNAAHACVRPDVTYMAMEALRNTFLAPIEHASEIEQRIVGKLVQDALAAGYSLSVWDGEEMTLVESTDADEVYKALASTDSDHLYIHTRETNPPGVQLIWGNDCSVISDYNACLETLLAGANALADELEG